MASLIVCRAPGDEAALFGGLILARPKEEFEVLAVFAHPLRPERREGEAVLRAACADLGVRHARLLPFAHLEGDAVDPDLIAEALPPFDRYERIYTHAVQERHPLAKRTAAAVGGRGGEIWTRAAGGAVDETVISSGELFARRLEVLNRHYPDLLAAGLIDPVELRTIDLFQRREGRSLYRYFRGSLEWYVDAFDYRRPWDLERSPYEAARHGAELAVVGSLPWRRLVEAAACEGAFTERLCQNFPDRQVVAYEPDRHFFATLRERLAGRAEVRQGDCEAAAAEPCDLLFFSSAVYYCPRLPYRMLDTPAAHLVVSHAQRYHEGWLDRVFQARGFACVGRREVPARIEGIEGLLDVRSGTEIKVWRRPPAGSDG